MRCMCMFVWEKTLNTIKSTYKNNSHYFLITLKYLTQCKGAKLRFCKKKFFLFKKLEEILCNKKYWPIGFCFLSLIYISPK